MRCYVTDEKQNLAFKEIKLTEGSGGEMKQVRVYSDTVYQTFLGMGGAFTEAAAYTWSKLSPENKDKLISLYFGPDSANYTFCRTHIQSCDFALGNYSYIEDETDTELKTFSIDRDKKYIIPLIKEALKKNNDIQFLASPWSPPGFMKTNGEMNHGGKLKEKYYEFWAKMVVRYVEEYEKEGIKISRLTVQNEPAATQTWDSCIYTATEESEYACNYLKPALETANKGDVKINVWDHNKEKILERARESFASEKAKKCLSGVAFHWYTGDHFDQLAQVRSEFLDKELIFTEGCVEYSKFKNDNQMEHAEMYAHEILGDFLYGANAFIDWNIYLDKNGGPNHVGNYCDSPVMCDVDKDLVKINKSYYYISHFSRFIKPGAKRILVSKYSDKIESLAFLNPDGEKVVILLNKSDENKPFELSCENKTCDLVSRAHSIMTLVF